MGANQEKGSILILITWMLLVIAVVAGFLLYRAELEWAVTLNLERNHRVSELARAVLTEHLALLAADDNDFDSPAEPWFNGNGIFKLERQGYKITVQVEDEGSKPRINLLGEKGLARINLLGEKGLARLLGEELSPDPVLDWIDSDAEQRENGAESPYYQGLNPAYKARDAFIASLHELKQVKDGSKYYEKLAPAVTVYGGYNPNTLSAEQFKGLLLGYGFGKYWVERVSKEFTAYWDRAREYERDWEEFRFKTLDDLLKLQSINSATRDKMEPVLQFGGCYNVNFLNKTNLEILLEAAGQKAAWAGDVVKRCQVQPMTSVDEIIVFFAPEIKQDKEQNQEKIKDYFTTVSTVFRYQVWLQKNQRVFYVTTVQKRVSDGLKRKWRFCPLSWLELKDEEAPPVPEGIAEKEQEGEE